MTHSTRIPFSLCTYMRLATEQHGLSVGAIAVGKRAQRNSTLVVVRSQHVVETHVTKLGQKPFDVGTRQSFQGIEAEAGVFSQHGAAHLARGVR